MPIVYGDQLPSLWMLEATRRGSLPYILGKMLSADIYTKTDNRDCRVLPMQVQTVAENVPDPGRIDMVRMGSEINIDCT